MNLEQQVCSLESAKRLKELGVEQSSYFWWELEHSLERTFIQHCRAKIVPRSYYDGTSPKDGFVSAFTVAELGEILPRKLEKKARATDYFCDYVLEPYKLESGAWELAYSGSGDAGSIGIQVGSEAETRAKMLIYLLESDLIPSPTKDNG